jgi:hypothetical protein
MSVLKDHYTSIQYKKRSLATSLINKHNLISKLNNMQPMHYII